MKNTKIAKKAFDKIEVAIDTYTALINTGAVSYSYSYANICGMLLMCSELDFITVDEYMYLTEAINFILPVNLKTERR